MEAQIKILTRRQVQQRYGFSLGYIDRHLPRKKVGGKVIILQSDLDRLLSGESDGDPVADRTLTGESRDV